MGQDAASLFKWVSRFQCRTGMRVPHAVTWRAGLSLHYMSYLKRLSRLLTPDEVEGLMLPSHA